MKHSVAICMIFNKENNYKMFKQLSFSFISEFYERQIENVVREFSAAF
jgi:hypothetical protein